MVDLQNKDIHDIAVNAEFHDFIDRDTGNYDFAGRGMEVRDSENDFSIDLLYVDLDSQAFRIDDLVMNDSVIGELQKEFSGVAELLDQRIKSIEADRDLQWRGQYRLRNIGNISETNWVDGELYSEAALTEEDGEKLDELSRNLLGYSLDRWEEYDWVQGSW